MFVIHELRGDEKTIPGGIVQLQLVAHRTCDGFQVHPDLDPAGLLGAPVEQAVGTAGTADEELQIFQGQLAEQLEKRKQVGFPGAIGPDEEVDGAQVQFRVGDGLVPINDDLVNPLRDHLLYSPAAGRVDAWEKAALEWPSNRSILRAYPNNPIRR